MKISSMVKLAIAFFIAFWMFRLVILVLPFVIFISVVGSFAYVVYNVLFGNKNREDNPAGG